MQKRCITCKFWDLKGGEGGSEYGYCRCNPPSAGKEQSEAAVWPVTQANDWCGKCELKSSSDE